MTFYNVALTHPLMLPGLTPAESQAFSKDGQELGRIQKSVAANWASQKALRSKQQHKVTELNKYLSSTVQENMLTQQTAELALQVWRDLELSFGERIQVPDAGIMPDLGVLYSWNNDEHHFEIEISESQQATLFYLNYHTDEMWEMPYIIGSTLPKEVSLGLKAFLNV
jgi:hypothetical protein